MLENTGTVNTAMDVLSKLAPAFAAGFAVQRLLEILDTWFDLEKRLSIWKKAILSVVSLIVGVLFAYRLDIRILTALGDSMLGQLSLVFDYVITGLVISGGTDGFNSILKFLNYSKETKKAEAENEKLSLPQADFGNANFFSFAAMASTGIQPSGDVAADLKTELHRAIKFTWKDKVDDNTWEATPFGDYEAFEDRPKIVVVDVTKAVARAYGKVLKNETSIRLANRVSLKSKPADILPEMEDAIVLGSIKNPVL